MEVRTPEDDEKLPAGILDLTSGEFLVAVGGVWGGATR